MKNTTESVFREIPYYHQLLGKKFVVSNYLSHEGFTDTTIRDINNKVFKSLTPMGNIYNAETQKYDIPIQYSAHTYINTANNHIDSVCVENITKNDFKVKTTYIVSDISYNNKQAFLDSIFDFNNRKSSKRSSTLNLYLQIHSQTQKITDFQVFRFSDFI